MFAKKSGISAWATNNILGVIAYADYGLNP